jgi:hypothetical protein
VSPTALAVFLGGLLGTGGLAPVITEVRQWLRDRRTDGASAANDGSVGDPWLWAVAGAVIGALGFAVAIVVVAFGLWSSLKTTSAPIVAVRVIAGALCFGALLASSHATARALRGKHDRTAVTGGIGVLAGLGALTAVVTVG